MVAAASDADVSVASSDPTGAPQAGQKRLAAGTSALQAVHRDMNFSADSVTCGSVEGVGEKDSGFVLPASVRAIRAAG